MSHADLETVYEALATRLDTIDEGSRALFLAKLALLLARELGDPGKVLGALDDAASDLAP